MAGQIGLTRDLKISAIAKRPMRLATELTNGVRIAGLTPIFLIQIFELASATLIRATTAIIAPRLILIGSK